MMQSRCAVAVLLASVVLAAASARGAAPARPKAVCEAARCDFGQAPASAQFEHEFVILNDGEAALRLSSLKVSQKGIVAKLSRFQVDAGASATVTVTGLMGVFSVEPRQAVTIVTSDPARPTLTLQLTGKVLAGPTTSTTTRPTSAPAVVHGISVAVEPVEQPPAPVPAASAKPVPATPQALRNVTLRICRGNEAAVAELRATMEELYRGVDPRTDRARFVELEELLKPSMDILGQAAGNGNADAMAALKSLLTASGYTQRMAADALGAAAVSSDEAAGILLDPKLSGLSMTATLSALARPAAAGNTRAVAYLVQVLDDPRSEAFSWTALKSLRPAAANGNAQAQAAIERYAKAHPK